MTPVTGRSVFGHDRYRINFHQKVRMGQSGDQQHRHRQRVGTVTPDVTKCLKPGLN